MINLDRNLIQNIAFSITILGSLMMLYISFLILYPINLMTFVQPYHVVSPAVNQGGGVNYEVEYCASKELFLIINRQLENIKTGELWDVPDKALHLTKGCSKEMYDVPVPLKIAAGNYKLRDHVSIRINALRTEYYDFESESFIIGNF